MNIHDPDANYDADLSLLDEPEFRHILGDLLEAVEQGETAAFDRYARQFPNYAPALLQTVLYAQAAEERMRHDVVTEPDPAVDAGIQAALTSLGIAPAKTLLAARTDRGWTLAELARRLMVPARLTLKLERGQIVRWPERLAARLSETMETTREYAESVLQATAGSFRMEAAAYSACGDPDVAAVAQSRRETFDFEEVLASESLTPEQAEFWKTDS